MWEPAISGMGNTHNCAPKLQAYPPIFSLTPKASGSTRLQSCEDKVFNSQYARIKNENSKCSAAGIMSFCGIYYGYSCDAVYMEEICK